MINNCIKMFMFMIVFVFCMSSKVFSQRYEEVDRTPQHAEARAMAAEIVFYEERIPECSVPPVFYVCSNNHLHWNLGDVGIHASQLPIKVRLEIEWFWKHLPQNSKQFWIPYIREIDGEIDRFIRNSKHSDFKYQDKLVRETYDKIELIYQKGINKYARENQVTPKKDPIKWQDADEKPKPCAAPKQIKLKLVSNVRGVDSIQWIDAGRVWETVLKHNREPQYSAYLPGAEVSVYAGAIYYFKLNVNGKVSKRQLAPEINSNQNGKKLYLLVSN
ncbi:hypothetical protein CA11_10530 [Gimesia maris]|uniref:hypothetical protein n=1 Tax=Gimesia maris TaxID=122 RepID=UPI001188FF9F|nr:hypothetical protein [Gimesia maris]QDU13271.1 hypothetical protein CA11_10530 [Gimesia maris]